MHHISPEFAAVAGPAVSPEAQAYVERWATSRRKASGARRMGEATIAVQLTRLQKFLRELANSGCTLANYPSAHLATFLDKPEMKKLKNETKEIKLGLQAKYRYLLLLFDLFELVKADGLRRDNPAADLLAGLKKSEELHEDAPPEILTRVQQTKLFELLGDEIPKSPWTAARDWALVKVALGSGLKAAELGELVIGDITFDGTGKDRDVIGLALEGTGEEARQVPLAAFASDAIKQWLAASVAMRPANDEVAASWPLFPSSRNPINATKKPECMCAEALYRAINRIVTALDMGKKQQGAQLLRNTYIVRQLENGVTVPVLQERLHIKDPAHIERFERVLTGAQRVA